MNKHQPLTLLLASITGGKYDEKLDHVAERVFRAVRNRRGVLSEEAVSEFQEGMKVRVKKGNFKPRYFIGLRGTIDHFDGDVVWIELDPPLKRPTKTIGRIGVKAIYVEPDE